MKFGLVEALIVLIIIWLVYVMYVSYEHLAGGSIRSILIVNDSCSQCLQMESLYRRRIMTNPIYIASVVNLDVNPQDLAVVQKKYDVRVDQLPALVTDDPTGIRIRNGRVEVQRGLQTMVTRR